MPLVTTRGKLILIEGLDRTGKSTQCEIISQKLLNCELIKFPDRTTSIGKEINSYLTDSEYELPDQSIHLLFSANRWERNEYIKNQLENGKNIVMDRYVYSGVAYSAAKGTPGMDLDWCYSCDKGLVRPDVTFFLMNKKSNENRDGFGDERYENNQFQEKVRLQFFKLFEKLGDQCDEVIQIDVTGCSIDEVTNQIWGHIITIDETTMSQELKVFQ